MKTVLSFNISAPERGNGDGRIFNGFRVKKEKEPLEKKRTFFEGATPFLSSVSCTEKNNESGVSGIEVTLQPLDSYSGLNLAEVIHPIASENLRQSEAIFSLKIQFLPDFSFILRECQLRNF